MASDRSTMPQGTKLYLQDLASSAVIEPGQLAELFEVAEQLSSEMELDRLARLIVEVVAKDTQADTVSLMLLDPRSKELTIKAAHGLPRTIVKSARLKVGEGIAGRVARTSRPMILSEDTPSSASIQRAMTQADTHSALCLPLLVNKKVLGVLNISRRSGSKPYTRSELEVLSVLCGQFAVAIRNAELLADVQRLQFGAVDALIQAIEARDPYTRGHSERVAEHCEVIARELHLPPKEAEDIRSAAQLHDVGKIGVPDSILLKPSSLTVTEMTAVKDHPVASAAIVAPLNLSRPMMELILHHHERYDGTGYPDGLAAEEIPLPARIASVADAFEAMTSDRAYRAALPAEEAMAELERGSGTQFDPNIVHRFLEFLRHEGRPSPPAA